MPTVLQALLTLVLILASGIWIGGYVTLVMVSVVSSKTLDPKDRVVFFRKFGATYFTVAFISLLVAYATGWALLTGLPWAPVMTRMALGSVVLLAVLALGIWQARSLNRMRARLALTPGDDALARAVTRGGRTAVVLRGLIGLVTLGIIINVTLLLMGTA